MHTLNLVIHHKENSVTHINKILLGLLVLFIMVPQAHAQEFTEAQKVEINKMIEEYVKANGKAVVESVAQYQMEAQEEAFASQNGLAKEFMASLDGQKNLPMTGNPKGDVTIVEFFDYNCGYCRKALEEVNKVTAEDKDVKVVFIEMPILGPQSIEIAKWSMAAQEQGKYFEFHTEVMNKGGPKDDAALEKVAKKLKLDVAKMKKDKESEAVNLALQANIKLAQDLGIRGTPGFIVGSEVIRGYVSSDSLLQSVKNARAK